MKLGKALYFGDFVAIPVAILGLALWAIPGRGPLAPFEWLASFAVGLFVWTFIEYGVHRWVFHEVPSSGIILAGFFAAPLAFTGPLLASGFASGALVGYAGYMAVHHAVHHLTPKPGTALYRARIRHMAHHYHGVDGNYGVTTGLWDLLFGTVVEGRRRTA